jgi:8-oxo-dGTP pyrophosphatase MutT (NUDIX family)
MNERERTAVREEVLGHAEDVLADVASQWGDITRLDPLVVEPFPDDDHSFPESADSFLSRFYPYAAGAVVTDEEGRLLCVYSPARDEWETPGGAGEPNETPAETARRETREESGVECNLTGVLFVQLMEINLNAPETLPIPIISFTGEHSGGDELAGSEIEAHEEITDLAWFGPNDLPTEVRNYEQKHPHLLSLADSTDGA